MKTEDEVKREIEALKKILKEPSTRDEDKPFIRATIASLQWVVGDTADVIHRLWMLSQIKKSQDEPN